MKTIVTVTQEDIDRGKRRQPEYCAIALAAKRAGVEDCRVGSSGISIPSKGILSYFQPDTCRWVQEFDLGLDVKPFVFEIDGCRCRVIGVKDETPLAPESTPNLGYIPVAMKDGVLQEVEVACG